MPAAGHALPPDGALRLLTSEVLRRLESSPLMEVTVRDLSPAQQERLAAQLLDLTALRKQHAALTDLPDISLASLAAIWPELAALLEGMQAAPQPAPGLVVAPPVEQRAAAANGRAAPPVVAEVVPPPPPVPVESYVLETGLASPTRQESQATAPTSTPAPAPAAPRRPGLGVRLAQRFPALQHMNFMLLWTGLIVSAAGTQMQQVGVNWLVLTLWNSPLALGVVSLAFALPMIVLPYLGGAVSDRVDRIALLKIAQVGQMICAGALTALTALGVEQIWEIVLITATSASFLAFDNPTRQALFPDLVTPKHLMSAISLQSAAFTGAGLFGPALAGVLLDRIHPAGIFFLNAVSYLAVLSALAQMKDVPSRAPSAKRAIRPWLSDGLTYVWRTKLVLVLLLFSFAGNLLGRSYIPLLAVFARDEFLVGPAGYGAMVAAAGFGALAGAIVLAGYGNVSHKGRLCVAGALLFCLALGAFALEPPFAVALVVLGLAGAMITVFGASISTMLQLQVPRELRGRVMSLYTITLVGVASLGTLGSAAVAAASSAPKAYLGGAVLFAVIAVLAGDWIWDVRTVVRTGPRAQPVARPVGN